MIDNKHCATVIASLIEHIGYDDFPASLLNAIDQLVGADSMVALHYRNDEVPKVLHDQIHSGDKASFYGPYLEGAYLLGPMFHAYWEGKRGFFALQNEAPEGFFESDFYRNYYGYSDLIDQVYFILEGGSQQAVALSIGRSTAMCRFSEEERELLQSLEPVFVALARQHWGSSPRNQPFAGKLHLAMERFGTSCLTDREHQVVMLMLRGHSSKSAARELNIAPQTEQVHRKNIYQKLKVSSHAELFSLFFVALGQTQATTEQDPLTALK